MKATAIAPSNIAFIKYWGKIDENLRIPTNGSISMNLSNLLTTTTVEFSKDFEKDSVIIDGNTIKNETNRVITHLDRIRKMAQINMKARVLSKNNFPSSTGLSSSASGFAALTVAASKAGGLNLKEKELSILARIASGSACRSIPSGFVEWSPGTTNDTSYAVSIFPPDWWNIVDIVAVISNNKKEYSTSDGQKLASSSPFFDLRLQNIGKKLREIKEFIKQKNFIKFGEMVEKEALEMHAVMLTSNPSLIYWQPETLRLMKLIQAWKEEGLSVYFTINTGQDIHLICEEKNIKEVKKRLSDLQFVRKIIINKPDQGARIIGDHLF